MSKREEFLKRIVSSDNNPLSYPFGSDEDLLNRELGEIEDMEPLQSQQETGNEVETPENSVAEQYPFSAEERLASHDDENYFRVEPVENDYTL